MLPPTKSVTFADYTGGFADCDKLELNWSYAALMMMLMMMTRIMMMIYSLIRSFAYSITHTSRSYNAQGDEGTLECVSTVGAAEFKCLGYNIGLGMAVTGFVCAFASSSPASHRPHHGHGPHTLPHCHLPLFHGIVVYLADHRHLRLGGVEHIVVGVVPSPHPLLHSLQLQRQSESMALLPRPCRQPAVRDRGGVLR